MSENVLTDEWRCAFLGAYAEEYDDVSDGEMAEIRGFDVIKGLGFKGGTNPVLNELIAHGYLDGSPGNDPRTWGLTNLGKAYVAECGG